MAAPVKAESYKLPSRFGTHRSMVVKMCDDKVHCVCEDEFGEYETLVERIDNNLADPARYRESRLGKLFGGTQKKDGD